jgi:hypothetical protein
MYTLRNKSLLVALLLVGCLSCKQTYLPPAVANPPNYLVVEGFINNGPDSTYFDLTHTYKLSDSTSTTPELGAGVVVEGSDNSVYSLSEVGNGLYGANLPALNTAATYRLHITTTGGKQYASDFVPVANNPPIDSVNFIRDNNGATIYVNSHDPTGKAKYFRWEYQETWEFHTEYVTNLLFVNDSLQLYYPDLEYTCWKGDNSTRVVLATTSQLSSDVVNRQFMVNYPVGSIQFSVKYSILVKQYALTQDAFAWWGITQNNTENIGSIFGVQPSTNQGNLHSLSDSTEQVIGYVSAGNLQSQRIFITNDQVAPWAYEPPCMIQKVPLDSVVEYYAAGIWPISYTFGMTGVNESDKFCIDCTLTGSNIPPPFWQ